MNSFNLFAFRQISLILSKKSCNKFLDYADLLSRAERRKSIRFSSHPMDNLAFPAPHRRLRGAFGWKDFWPAHSDSQADNCPKCATNASGLSSMMRANDALTDMNSAVSSMWRNTSLPPTGAEATAFSSLNRGRRVRASRRVFVSPLPIRRNLPIHGSRLFRVFLAIRAR